MGSLTFRMAMLLLVLVGAVGLLLFPPTETQEVVVTEVVVERYPEYIFVDNLAEDPDYIVIEIMGLHFTELEYRARVVRQIARDGWNEICVDHLLTLAIDARTYSVNSARQNLAYVTECAERTGAFTTIEE